MILLLLIFFSASPLSDSESIEVLPSIQTNVSSRENSGIAKTIPKIFHKVSKTTFYFTTGSALAITSVISKAGSVISKLFPSTSIFGNECLLLSDLSWIAAKHFFSEIGTGSFSHKSYFSQASWYLNEKKLSQIPTSSEEEEKLLLFLKNRWLAKATGFFPIIVDWVCPSFDVLMQIHPRTTSAYARSPFMKISEDYKTRVDIWKEHLPHPKHFPLILTRPFDLQDYFPGYVELQENETAKELTGRLAKKNLSAEIKTVVDVTRVFQKDDMWLENWNVYKAQFSESCKEANINLAHILCIQKINKEEIGGIRILPLELSAKEIEKDHQFLLEWISTFGLSANRIELDRWSIPSKEEKKKFLFQSTQSDFQKEQFLSFVNDFEREWKSDHPQKTFMVHATLKVIKGLFTSTSQEKWEEIKNCKTRSSIASLSINQIKDQLGFLQREETKTSFFDAMIHVEQIHASLSALLEILSPFHLEDFSPIYQSILTCIPKTLEPFTSYGIHSAGMTTLGGIFKAVEKSMERKIHVLYGENTYFECMRACDLATHAKPIKEAVQEDLENVDLILAQFNPVLKRIDLKVVQYEIEDIAEILHRALGAKKGKPLTLALDSTFDFIDAPRVGELLTEFQEEIQSGKLSIVCYRSGTKFHLLGMDNYCGAPFYIIHNKDPKWGTFDALLTDPLLQTDKLSVNWFCLAYKHITPELELYQKQVFDNTRALLKKIPRSLFNVENSRYRVTPFTEEAEPAFIDIKVSGPFHKARAAALAGGSLYVNCMEEGHPIFYRLSLGFYHPNFTILFTEQTTTIRLTLGLDPGQVDVLSGCFERLDGLSLNKTEMISFPITYPLTSFYYLNKGF